jgi:hypothetical protein
MPPIAVDLCRCFAELVIQLFSAETIGHQQRTKVAGVIISRFDFEVDGPLFRLIDDANGRRLRMTVQFLLHLQTPGALKGKIALFQQAPQKLFASLTAYVCEVEIVIPCRFDDYRHVSSRSWGRMNLSPGSPKNRSVVRATFPFNSTLRRYASIFFTMSPCTSVSRKSRPWKRNVNFV